LRFLTIIAATVWLATVWLAGLAPGQSSSTAPSAAKQTAAPKTVSKSPAKSTVRSAPPKAAAKGAPARRTAATASKAQSKSGAGSKKTVAVRRPVQQQPTADRYQEIQQALADKGYFRGTVDGNWGPESSEALKSFQRDQNLDSDGKIGALSLMALGLGPKRGTASAQNISKLGSPAAGEPAAAGEPPAAGEPVDPPPVALPQP
jgi:peptidoglycan hydrolase-like protein with peptidoglycan-binding domain